MPQRPPSTVRDQSVLVVGATGGLGAPIARRLHSDGARLTLAGRDKDRLTAMGVPGHHVVADIRRSAAASRVVAQAQEHAGGLDAVVVATGAVAFAPAAQTPDDVLIELFTLNTLAPIRLLRAATPALEESARSGGCATFVVLSAVVAERPVVGMAAYAATKAAVSAFDEVAGRELRRSGIRVVDVRPPHTETGLAGRPLLGEAPRLPAGLDPDVVAERVVRSLTDGSRDIPSTDF